MNNKTQAFKGSIDPKASVSATQPPINSYNFYSGTINKAVVSKPVHPEYKPLSVPDMKAQNVRDYKTPVPYCPPKFGIGGQKSDPNEKWFSLPKSDSRPERPSRKAKPKPKEVEMEPKKEEQRPQMPSSYGSIMRSFSLFLEKRPDNENSTFITANTVRPPVKNSNSNSNSNSNGGDRPRSPGSIDWDYGDW